MTISLDAKVTALNDFMAKFGARIASMLKLPIEELNIQETDLVLGVAFNTKTNVYKFEIFGKPDFPFEQRLSEKDVFLPTDIKAYTLKADKDAGDFAAMMLPYIDKVINNGILNGATEVKALESWWGGKLKIERGGGTIVENFRLRNLMFVPDKQMSDGRYPTIGGEGFKLTRKPNLGGKDKISISVEMGEMSAESRALIVGNVDAAGDVKSNMQNYGIIVLSGFLFVDAAEPFSKL
jgi:hypothetical protein